MDFLIEIIFLGLIVNFLGLYTRFYFFKLIRKPKSIKYLSGEINKKDDSDIVQQHAFNVFIGIITFVIISITIAFFVFS